MSVNTTKTPPIDASLLLAPFQLNIWFGIFIFVTGNISALGNLIVFSSRNFRRRACAIYLINEAFFNFIYFDFVLVTRVVQKGFRLPIINRYDVICKIRQFLSQYVHQVAFTLFSLATLDRLLSTQRSMGRYRIFSSASHCDIVLTFVFMGILSTSASHDCTCQVSRIHRTFSLGNSSVSSITFCFQLCDNGVTEFHWPISWCRRWSYFGFSLLAIVWFSTAMSVVAVHLSQVPTNTSTFFSKPSCLEYVHRWSCWYWAWRCYAVFEKSHVDV